jgi:hypothetical protein
MNWMKSKSYSFTQLSILLHAPARAGVYHLHTTARCIYVGATENIRQSLLGHLPAIYRGSQCGIRAVFHSRYVLVRREFRGKKDLVTKLHPLIGDRHQTVDDASGETLAHGMQVPLARS